MIALLLRLGLCLLLLMLAATRARGSDAHILIRDPGQGAFAIDTSAGAATELSGIAHLSGTDFITVGDAATRVDLSVAVAADSGLITAAAVVTSSALPGGDGSADSEGVVVDSAAQTFWVSDEEGPAIREHALADSQVVGALTIPAVFSNIRSNLSFESLGRAPDSGALWTTTESALSVDGPTATLSEGTWLRLQRFDSGGTANGQWAYRTDPIPGALGGSPFTSGVSDLLALPDGDLLVLERALGTTGFRNRIYRVDSSGASDTSVLVGLDGAVFTPVNKQLLWEKDAIPGNFEGIALGEMLATGERSLLLVSDNAGSGNSLLYPLAIHIQPALPVPTLPYSGRRATPDRADDVLPEALAALPGLHSWPLRCFGDSAPGSVPGGGSRVRRGTARGDLP